MATLPTPEQFQAMATSADTGPFVMLNLLRFKDRADGIDEGMSGAEAYARYSIETEPFLRGVGGRLLYVIRSVQSVVGPEEAEWDLILLVEYPSRAKFIEMAMNPDYQQVHAHREAALADSRIIACAELPEAMLAALGAE
jgi:uncharacterized protein (DUF1330 family)